MRQLAGAAGIMDPLTHGCWVDILQVMQFTGQLMGSTNSKTAIVPPPIQVDVQTAQIHQGPAFLIRSFLLLGADNTAQMYGYIDSWSYQIAAWTQDMIPMTCVISVSFTLLPFGDKSAAAAKKPVTKIPPGGFGPNKPGRTPPTNIGKQGGPVVPVTGGPLIGTVNAPPPARPPTPKKTPVAPIVPVHGPGR